MESEFVKTFGVVIKQNDVGDADRSLTLLTADCGKIHIWVNGARRVRSKHLAASQLFCASNLVLYKGRNTYRLNTSEIIEPFFNLRTDLDKLNCAAFLVELTNDGVQEGCEERVGEIMKLLLNSLHFIANTDKKAELITNIFGLKFMSLIGFELLFENDTGINAGYGMVTLSNSVILAVKHILSAKPEKLFSFNLAEEALKELTGFCRRYIEFHMGKNYKVYF